MPNSWRIAQQMGIKMHGRRDPHPGGDALPPRHTWARKSIFDVARAGDSAGLSEHVFDVLGLFLASGDNQTQLYGDAISGVSLWMLRHKVSTAEVTFLRPAFETLDIRLIRKAVQHHGIPQRKPQIAFLVADHMEDALMGLRA